MSRAPGDCRAAAARCLVEVARGQSLSVVLGRAEATVSPRDRGLLRELCYGALRWYPCFAPLTEALLSRPLKARDRDIGMLLVVGAYQLLRMGLAPHAAVASSVEATRGLDKAWARGLVNAVLRRLQRESELLLAALPEAARNAHPEWLWRALVEAWGTEAQAVMAAGNSHPPLFLRVNVARGTVEEYCARLRAAGIEASRCESAPEGLRLERAQPVESLPGFTQGEVSVQDEAAQRVAGLVPLAPGARVLDACAAPGGKAAHLLELQPGLRLTALDLDAERLQRVADNLQRLGLSAQLAAADASRPDRWWNGELFDVILVDAPCSGSGVIRRHPDIKLLRRAADIPALAARQLQLLQALWPLLRPGGTLLYTTCSALPAENVEVARAFSDAAGEAAEPWPIEARWGMEQAPGRQQLPRVDGPDGFYYARWRRAAASAWGS